MNIDPQKLIEQAIGEVAKGLGVEIDAEQLVELGAKAVVHIGDMVSAKAWRDAHAAGDTAASQITTLEEAEASAKKAR